MPRRRDPNPAMPRGRRRGPPRPRPVPGDHDHRLAEEVLYLHSLWRRGPPAPVPTQAPSSAAARKTKRPAVAARKAKSIESKRPKRAAAAAAYAVEPKDNGSEWPVAPSPPNSSPRAWPETAPPSTSTPAKPPPTPPSPGAVAQRDALHAAAEFLSNRASSSDDDDGGSESDGEEDEAAGFITGLFERDAALRGHYERGWEGGQFECLACAGGKRKAGRRFKGCVALVHHAGAGAGATRYGRPRAHRALADVVCRVLGWDVSRLPSIVIDPRGTLGQALAAEAAAGVHQPTEESDDTGEENDNSGGEDEEEDAETGMEDSSTDGDEEDNECRSSEEYAEKEDVEKGMEESKSTDKDDEEAIELDNSEKSSGKEEMEEVGPSNCSEISKNDVFQNEPVQEDNAGEGDSFDQGNNGEVDKQEVAKESSEQENTNDAYPPDSKDTCKNDEHCKEAAVQKEEIFL